MRGLEFTDPRDRFGPRLDRGANAADVAANHDADDPAVKLDDRARQLDVGRLEHGVDPRDDPDQTLGFDQTQCAAHVPTFHDGKLQDCKLQRLEMTRVLD